MKQKARRGELFLTVAIGYVKVRHNRIEKDPDLRIREAIDLVFRKFSEFQSIRQVHLWMRRERRRRCLDIYASILERCFGDWPNKRTAGSRKAI